MADEKSGMEKLRAAAEQTSSKHCSICDASGVRCLDHEDCDDAIGRSLSEIAAQIEREHAEELAAAKRDMTDDARVVVERLLAVDADGIYGSESMGNAMCRAVNGRDDGEETWRESFGKLRNRLVELIEHGGRQDVDVAALLELADELERERIVNKGIWLDCGNRESLGASAALFDVAERIREAVEGAPQPDAEREAAADWVEANGGLDAVQKRMVAFAYMLNRVDSLVSGDDQRCFDGPFSIDELSELFGVIMAELDKRLMPQRMEWPRRDDGKPLAFGEIVGDEGSAVHEVCFVSDGTVLLLDDTPETIMELAIGERVKRPEPEVLGADSRPIRKGEIVYGLSGGEYVVAEVHASKTPQNTDEPWVGYVDGGWDRASSVTHTPPDTQERINEDATRDPAAYCNEVLAWDAEKIVHRTDYATQNEAMVADLLRRQRELDAKMMGGE